MTFWAMSFFATVLFIFIRLSRKASSPKPFHVSVNSLSVHFSIVGGRVVIGERGGASPSQSVEV